MFYCFTDNFYFIIYFYVQNPGQISTLQLYNVHGAHATLAQF